MPIELESQHSQLAALLGVGIKSLLPQKFIVESGSHYGRGVVKTTGIY